MSLNDTIKKMAGQQSVSSKDQQNQIQYNEMMRIIEEKNEIILNLKRSL
jgi:hypothetical protein